MIRILTAPSEFIFALRRAHSRQQLDMQLSERVGARKLYVTDNLHVVQCTTLWIDVQYFLQIAPDATFFHFKMAILAAPASDSLGFSSSREPDVVQVDTQL